MISYLKNTPVRELIRALERMGLAIEDARAVKGFIAMRMVGELFSITITLRIPFPQGRSRVFWTERTGLIKISDDSA
jgi:hypothetical protein